MPPTLILVMQATVVDPTPLSVPLVFEFSGRASRNRFLKASISERQATWDYTRQELGYAIKRLVDVYRLWGERRAWHYCHM